MADIIDHTEKDKQKEVIKTAIKKLIDATVDIGVELYFTSKDNRETIIEEVQHEESNKRDTDSSRKDKKRK